MKERIKEICIDSKSSVLAALKLMDTTRRKLLIVTADGKYHSVLSIGDIQRAIIKGDSMDEPIKKYCVLQQRWQRPVRAAARWSST